MSFLPLGAAALASPVAVDFETPCPLFGPPAFVAKGRLSASTSPTGPNGGWPAYC